MSAVGPGRPWTAIGGTGPGSAFSTVLITVVVVAALYFGREVLVPMALAVLLSFVLAPPVRLMESWRVPRSLAVVVVALIAFAAISGLGALMFSQVNQLASDLSTIPSDASGKDTNPAGGGGWHRHSRTGIRGVAGARQGN